MIHSPTKRELKFIQSLKYKKYRIIHKSFIAEGIKTIDVLINGGAKCKLIVVEKNYYKNSFFSLVNTIPRVTVCEAQVLKRISNFKTPPKMIGIFEIHNNKYCSKAIQNSISFVYENLQDPGNFGSIIRTTSWFGIQNIFLSKGSVDMYSPKVIQASMGAIVNVNIFYENLEKLFKNEALQNHPIYGTFLKGKNIYKTKLPQKGFIVFGNEGHGISKILEKLIDKKISIPAFNFLKNVNSLNIAAATTTVCTLLRWSK